MTGPGASLTGWLGRLRFKNLVLLGLALLVIDILLPDPIPLLDELLIAVLTLLLSRFKRPPPPSIPEHR